MVATGHADLGDLDHQREFSWMQTPVGLCDQCAKGQFVPSRRSWLPIIFNPSFPFRLVPYRRHCSVSDHGACRWARSGPGTCCKRSRPIPARARCFRWRCGWRRSSTPIQIFAGDTHGPEHVRNTSQSSFCRDGGRLSEPSPHGAPLILFGLPSNAQGRVLYYAIEVPKVRRIADPEARSRLRRWPGLDSSLPRDRLAARRPSCSGRSGSWSGWALRCWGLGCASLLARWRAASCTTGPGFHRGAVVMGPAGFVAVLAGWTTTEVGRQPLHRLRPAADQRSRIRLSGRLRWQCIAAGICAGLLAARLARAFIILLAHDGASRPQARRSPSPHWYMPPVQCRHHHRYSAVDATACQHSERWHDRWHVDFDLTLDLGRHHRFCGVRLCRDGRL